MQMPSSISTRLQYQHKSLLELIEGLSDDQIRNRPNPNKWSIFEQIVHLETYQYIFIERVRRVLEGQSPVFDPYRADDDPIFIEHCGFATREVMQKLLTVRKELANDIMHLPELDLQKSGTHSIYGTMDLLAWLNMFLLHEAHHLYSIFQLARTRN